MKSEPVSWCSLLSYRLIPRRRNNHQHHCCQEQEDSQAPLHPQNSAIQIHKIEKIGMKSCIHAKYCRTINSVSDTLPSSNQAYLFPAKLNWYHSNPIHTKRQNLKNNNICKWCRPNKVAELQYYKTGVKVKECCLLILKKCWLTSNTGKVLVTTSLVISHTQTTLSAPQLHIHTNTHTKLQVSAYTLHSYHHWRPSNHFRKMTILRNWPHTCDHFHLLLQNNSLNWS